MSRTIDEKVVEMRFDNRDFERNVSQSMSTLDKLKGALNFSGMEKAFDGITSAANKVDLGGITKAFDGIEGKVSNLQKVIDGFFENLGRRISNFAIDQVKGLTLEPVMEGFGKYEQKSKAVQTIMNATGKEIEEVSKQLEKLNWYTDETSYDFAEMVTTVGKFTSSGVELEQAVTAMQGIANWAAVSGAEKQQANMAMYNLAQALGMGFVGAADYRSIMNANMDTREFKQMVIDEAIKEGTLAVQTLEDGTEVLVAMNKETKELIYENEKEGKLLEVNADNFYSTLTKGKWFDRDVLLNVTDKYGRFSNLLNQFYTDVVDNGFDLTTSELIAYVDAYKEGTLDMNDAIRETGLSAEYLTDMLGQLGSAEFELSEKAFKAGNESRTFKDAIDATKDAVSTAWMNTFELLFGNYEEAKVLWTALTNELWDIFAGPITDINKTLSKWRKIKLDDGTFLDGRDDFIASLADIYHAARSIIDPITEAWEAIFPPIDEFQLYDITKRFHEFTSGLALDETRMNQIRMVFEDLFNIFKAFTTGFNNGGGLSGFFGGIGDIIGNVTDKVYDFFLGIQRIRSVIADYESGNLGEFSFVQQTIDAYPAAAKALDIYEKLVKTAETLGQTFGKLFDVTKFFKDGAITIESITDGIKENVANVLSAITELVHIWTGTDIGKTIGNIRAILFDLFDGVKAFLGSERWSDVKYAISGIANAFKDTFGPAWQAAVAIFDDWIAGIRTMISGADGDFNGFFDTIMRGAYWVADFVRSWKGGVEFISEFLTKFLSLTDAIEVYRANGGGILGVLAVINDKLRIILDTIADLIQNVTGFDVHGIGDSILDVIQSIGYAVLQVADTISKVFGWTDNPFGKLLGSINEGFGGGPEGKGFDISGIFDKIGEAFSRLGELVNKVAPGVSALLATVGDAFKNLWELIGQIRLEDLIRIFQGIASIMLIFQGKKTLAELGDTLEAYQKKLKADMLFAIAGSILMIAGAALMISKIDAKKIGLVLGTLGVSFGGLIGMMIASKWANPKALAALPGTVLAIAASMVILAKAAEMMTAPIQAFANMENFWSGMGRLGTVMGSFLVLLGSLAALNQSGAVLGASKSLGKLAGVMTIMLPLVLVYSKIDFEKLAGGIGRLFTALSPLLAVAAGLSVMQSLLSKFIHEIDFDDLGSGLLKISGALAVLTAVLFALTYLGWDDFFSAFGKMALGFAAITAAIAAFSFGVAVLGPVMGLLDKFASSLLKLGTAILFISAGVGLLGIIATILGDSAQAIAEAGVGLIVTVLDAIVARTPEIAEDIVLFILGVLDAVADHTPEIIDACVRIIGGIMEGVRMALTEGGIQLGDLFAGGGILSGLIGLVWLLKKMKLNVGDFANAALALAGAGLLLVEIGGIFVGLGKLSALVGGVEGINGFREFCTAIVNVFREDWGVGAMFVAVAGLLVLFDKLKLDSFGGKALLSLIKVIAEISLVVEVIGLIFAAFGGIIGFIDSKLMEWGVTDSENGVEDGINKFGSFISAIVGVIGDAVGRLVGGIAGGAVEGAMRGYADGLKYIADTAGEFFTLMDGLKPGTLKGCKMFGEMILALTGADILDGLFSWATGGVDYKKFGDGLKDLAPGIAEFAEKTKDIEQGDVEKAAACAEMIIAFAKDIPNDGGMISWFTGNNNLGDFAEDLAAFGPALSKFSMDSRFINREAVEKASACADMVIAFAKEVPNDGGLIWLIAGDNRLKDFAEDLAAFGPALSGFAMDSRFINQEAVEKAAACADMIIAFAKEVPNDGGMITWFTGDNSLDSFGANLVKFGKSLVSYSQTLSSEDFSLQVIKNTNSAIETVIDMANSVAGKDGKGMPDVKNFGEKLKSFGSSFADYYKNVKDIDSTKVDNLSGAVNRMVKSFIGSEDTSLAGQVAKFTSDFLDKLSSAFGGSESKKKSEKSADKFIDFFKDRFKSDTSVNKVSVSVSDMISKAVGKDELKEGLKQSGIDLVGQLQNGITEAFEGEEGLIAKFTSFLNTLATGIATDGQSGSKKQYYDAGASLVGALRNGMVNEEAVSGFGTPPAKQLKEDFKGLLDSLIGMIVSEEMKGQFQRGGASLINSLVGGMKSVDISTETSGIGKNATIGLGNGMIDESAVAQVKKNAAYVMNTATTTMKNEAQEKSPSKLTALYGWYLDGGLSDGLIDGIPMVVSAVGSVVDETKEAFTKSAERGGFDIHSNSWLTTLFGRFLSGGFADGIIDGIPGVKDAIAKVRAAITDEMGLNDLMNLLHDNGLGALENTFADYVAQFGADFSLDEAMNNFDIQGQMDEFQNEYLSNMNSFNSEYTSFMSGTSTDGMEALTASYSDSSYVTDGVSTLMNNTSNAFGSYNDMMGTQGTEGTYSFYNNIGDSAMSAAESITPTVTSASQMVADAATAPIEEGIVEILSYVDWLKEAYPEGLTEAFSTPVFDFTELYENMGGGQLEAILNSFDALDETGRKNLIRAYGLGEQGGNEDLANYLTWYWKNEPVRLKNEEAIAQAQAGYQAYLEEQKALQEAQAIQSQQHYEGVQQIAGDMQAHTDEFNAKYMAAIEEIKMSVLSIQEELNGVHADIAELNNMDVYIDSNALVGATADKYNEELGNMAKIGRRNVTR